MLSDIYVNHKDINDCLGKFLYKECRMTFIYNNVIWNIKYIMETRRDINSFPYKLRDMKTHIEQDKNFELDLYKSGAFMIYDDGTFSVGSLLDANRSFDISNKLVLHKDDALILVNKMINASESYSYFLYIKNLIIDYLFHEVISYILLYRILNESYLH